MRWSFDSTILRGPHAPPTHSRHRRRRHRTVRHAPPQVEAFQNATKGKGWTDTEVKKQITVLSTYNRTNKSFDVKQCETNWYWDKYDTNLTQEGEGGASLNCAVQCSSTEPCYTRTRERVVNERTALFCRRNGLLARLLARSVAAVRV